ncbi:hypothetical protein CEXT_462591 [Caerostris extrusa]|uniref:Uncharacterized protein n=1 Tax=Caerostris extrusa TaxID=172846 RepID=A0AAV4VCW3_CAEEX|nr:hypothetical protein CEXT_462591 [Caerostris extrusa]
MCPLQTIYLQKKKTWNNCERNPFSNMSSRIGNDLVAFSFSREKDDRPKIEELQLLLKSDHLERVDFRNSTFSKAGCIAIFQLFTDEARLNLLYLSLTRQFQNSKNFSIEMMIQKCPKLQFLETETFFNLDVLEYCPDLLGVRMLCSNREVLTYFRHRNVAPLKFTERLMVMDVMRTVLLHIKPSSKSIICCSRILDWIRIILSYYNPSCSIIIPTRGRAYDRHMPQRLLRTLGGFGIALCPNDKFRILLRWSFYIYYLNQ